MTGLSHACQGRDNLRDYRSTAYYVQTMAQRRIPLTPGGPGEANRQVCVPQIHLQFSGPLDKVHFFYRDVGGGGLRLRGLGCHSPIA